MTSETFSLTAGQIIENALRDARIIPAEQPIQPKDLVNGLQAINIIIKHWQAQGIHLWSEKEALLPLIPSRRKYILGPNGDDIAVADTFFTTFLRLIGSQGDTSIGINSDTGTNSDGESLTMSGAPDILESSPLVSTQDWTTSNDGILTVVGGNTLQLENGSTSLGSASYNLATVPGERYRIDFGYTQGTSSTCSFFAEDQTGILTASTLASTGSGTLDFTARDTTTTFRFQNNDAVLGATSILDSLNYRDKSTGDRIGIFMDDGTIHWDDVVSITEGLVFFTVDINNGLPSAANLDNTVYTYAESINRPMRVLQTRYASSLTASEIPTRQWSRDDYFDQPDKDSVGTVVNWYYTPTLTQGELYVWQVASSINNVLRFTYVDSIEIPTTTDDSLEFPSEWYMPLKWAVAAELGPSRGVSDNRQVILETKAAKSLDDVLGFDVERDNMSLQPDFN